MPLPTEERKTYNNIVRFVKSQFVKNMPRPWQYFRDAHCEHNHVIIFCTIMAPVLIKIFLIIK